MTKRISLSVNDVPIELDYFVEGFIDHTVGGMLLALEGTGKITALDISVEADEMAISLNGATVPIKPFVKKIFKSTIFGMVSSLKGVSEINRVNVGIVR